MNLKMDPLVYLLATHPIQTGSKISIELYWPHQFGCIGNLVYHFANSSVRTWTWTRSDGPEMFLAVLMHGRSLVH
jgi:hypothetical protein